MYDSRSKQFGRSRLKRTLRTAIALFFACAVVAFSPLLQAQRFDVAAGISGIDAPGRSAANDINHEAQSLTGGAYMTFSGDFLFYKNIGVEGEFLRRYNQTIYYPIVTNPTIRPMFFDLNAIWTRKLYKRFTGEVEGGMGTENIRFYTGSCSGGDCYVNKYHLMADVGAGIKVYPLNLFIVRHIFLRPEGRFYLIRKNQEFSSSHAIRFGAEIGYTF